MSTNTRKGGTHQGKHLFFRSLPSRDMFSSSTNLTKKKSCHPCLVNNTYLIDLFSPILPIIFSLFLKHVNKHMPLNVRKLLTTVNDKSLIRQALNMFEYKSFPSISWIDTDYLAVARCLGTSK